MILKEVMLSIYFAGSPVIAPKPPHRLPKTNAISILCFLAPLREAIRLPTIIRDIDAKKAVMMAHVNVVDSNYRLFFLFALLSRVCSRG
ncbi:MAG: hypothetical protein K7J15_00310 [Candidatus Regiella insecticola]|nr:hypothetical protein [Candidatus Regiella insecticola]